MSPTGASAGAHFRRVLQQNKCIAAPGVFCGIVGRMAKQKGFQAGYVSGAALTASAGVPDIGLLTLDHFCNRIKEISTVAGTGLPLICDADTGFGEAEMVSRTVCEYIKAGAGGLHIEDQVFPKRCGHLDGKSLVSQTDFEKCVRNAKAAALASDPDFIVCARTDARSVTGFEESVKRGIAYVNAGADMIFPEGLESREEFKEYAKQIREGTGKENLFLLANMTEFGKTPYIPLKEFEEMGYNIVIYPVSTLRCAMKAASDCLDVIKNEGGVEGHLEAMYTRKELYGTLGYTPGKEWVWPNADS